MASWGAGHDITLWLTSSSCSSCQPSKSVPHITTIWHNKWKLRSPFLRLTSKGFSLSLTALEASIFFSNIHHYWPLICFPTFGFSFLFFLILKYRILCSSLNIFEMNEKEVFCVCQKKRKSEIYKVRALWLTTLFISYLVEDVRNFLVLFFSRNLL